MVTTLAIYNFRKLTVRIPLIFFWRSCYDKKDHVYAFFNLTPYKRIPKKPYDDVTKLFLSLLKAN